MLVRLSLAFALVCTLLGGSVLYAQQQDETKGDSPVLTSGEYRDLNFWRKMKLGTAPFVNPALLEQTSVAFKYDPKSVAASNDWSKIASLVQAGKIGLGVPTDDGYVVAPYGDGDWLGEADSGGVDPVELGNVVEQRGIVLVSKDDRLFDAEPVGKLVSWERGQLLAPADPERGPPNSVQ